VFPRIGHSNRRVYGAPGTSRAAKRIAIAGYLRLGLIVYRSAPGEIGFYEYQRWAADPRMLSTSAAIDRLSATGQFSLVSMYDLRSDIE